MEFVAFELTFYEITENNTINVYIDDLKKRLDQLKIKYELKSRSETDDLAENPQRMSPSIDKISEMDGKDESIMNSLLSSIDTSTVSQTDKKSIISMDLYIYEDNLENTRYFGIQQLNSWLLRREKEKNMVPCI
jgi:hypothetical protein